MCVTARQRSSTSLLLPTLVGEGFPETAARCDASQSFGSAILHLANLVRCLHRQVLLAQQWSETTTYRIVEQKTAVCWRRQPLLKTRVLPMEETMRYSWRAFALLACGTLFYMAAQAGQSPTEPPSAESTSSGVPQVTPDKPMSFWMAKKLDHSKAVLESLTKGDFEKVRASAEQLQFLGRMEGLVRSHADYRAQLQSFDLATHELIRQAKRKNPDGAVSAFNQLTTSCVACHSLLREGVE